MTKTKLFSVGIGDCRVDTFTVGGHGGSGKDTSNTGVRVTHEPSGASAEGTRERSQLSNKRTAFISMVNSPKFRLWLRLEASRKVSGKTLDQLVDEDMVPAKLRVERRNSDGKWEVDDV